MKINNLKLLNFRNYEKIELSFSPSYNIIYGENGVGKTNLVEGIYVLVFLIMNYQNIHNFLP